MLIDRFLPEFDVTQVIEIEVDAPLQEVYAAILETDLRDPVINTLFALREIPLRISRRFRGETAPPPHGRVTFGDIARGTPGWTLLCEEPGAELVIGSVGRIWQRDYGSRPVTRDEFTPFREPGYAKVALSFAVRPAVECGTLLRYEARTATTDDFARRRFRRYWRIIHPGVALVMRRALTRIKTEAERRAAAHHEPPTKLSTVSRTGSRPSM